MDVTHTPESSEYSLTVGEAAKLVYLSTDTIRRYADKGILRSVRTPGGQRRFAREDVLSLLTSERAS